MQKAILVTEFQSVGALNELLVQGYKVQSADERGVYILDAPESTRVPIKDNIEAVVSLDTSKAQRQLKLLGETVKALKEKHEEKQPHVRIEFDDVLDVPKVWVDGKLFELDSNPLVRLSLDWNTDTAKEEHKAFEIEYFNVESHQRKAFSEGSFR